MDENPGTNRNHYSPSPALKNNNIFGIQKNSNSIIQAEGLNQSQYMPGKNQPSNSSIYKHQFNRSIGQSKSSESRQDDKARSEVSH